jgi:hypothetical protein
VLLVHPVLQALRAHGAGGAERYDGRVGAAGEEQVGVDGPAARGIAHPGFNHASTVPSRPVRWRAARGRVVTAFSEHVALDRFVRYEEAAACADLVREMAKEREGDDPMWEFTEKHTGRVLTHSEVYAKALTDAFHMLYERAEGYYEEGR